MLRKLLNSVFVFIGFMLAKPLIATVGADLQFFGDTYIPTRIIESTQSTPGNLGVFTDVKGLLRTSKINVVNLEGPIARGLIAPHRKTYTLQMPQQAAPLLKGAGIDIVTLGNNHSLDYGWPGLQETLWNLNHVGITAVGAGKTILSASAPTVFFIAGKTVCLYSYSMTLPEEFWADAKTPGTHKPSLETMKVQISYCRDHFDYTIASFHWGQELSPHPKKYQKEFARAAIDAGAQLVIGHHPHVLQDVEFYRSRPIAYSIGNFAFGTIPVAGKAEGMAVRLRIETEETIEFVILNVDNKVTKYLPKIASTQDHPSLRSLKDLSFCKQEVQRWRCRLKIPDVLAARRP